MVDGMVGATLMADGMVVETLMADGMVVEGRDGHTDSETDRHRQLHTHSVI